MEINIKYNNKDYIYEANNYISIHHNIINFYENILKKELHYFKNIYISHILNNKDYILCNEKSEELNKNSLLNNKEYNFIIKINHNEKYIFDLCMPYIKVLIISLLIIIRIDIFLSTSFNNHIKSFEDYYILLLYIFTILIIILIFYYSYKVIYRFLEYVMENLDKDIGVFMGSYIESYNIMDSNNYNYKINHVNNYVNNYVNKLFKKNEKNVEEKEEEVKGEKEEEEVKGEKE
jgi:hypothetical protein